MNESLSSWYNLLNAISQRFLVTHFDDNEIVTYLSYFKKVMRHIFIYGDGKTK